MPELKSGWLFRAVGIPNKTQVGDMGIDGRIYPVGAEPKRSGKAAGELDSMDEWYPIQLSDSTA